MADKISGYHLTRQWFDFCQETDYNIKPIHTAIYMYTIHLCNQLKWKPVFGLPTSETMKILGISNYTTYRVALEEIINFGFIKMIEKSKNQYTSNRICLVQNRSSTVLSTVLGTVLSTVSVVKQLKTEKNVESVETLKTGLVEIFKTVRTDVPQETLEIEAGMFLSKYPGKDLQKDINLINAWAKKIKFIPPVNKQTEFDKIAKSNKERYGI